MKETWLSFSSTQAVFLHTFSWPALIPVFQDFIWISLFLKVAPLFQSLNFHLLLFFFSSPPPCSLPFCFFVVCLRTHIHACHNVCVEFRGPASGADSPLALSRFRALNFKLLGLIASPFHVEAPHRPVLSPPSGLLLPSHTHLRAHHLWCLVLAFLSIPQDLEQRNLGVCCYWNPLLSSVWRLIGPHRPAS